MTDDASAARTAIAKHYARTDPLRHALEVKFVASWVDHDAYPDRERMNAYFAGVEEKRGPLAADRLREDVRGLLKKTRAA